MRKKGKTTDKGTSTQITFLKKWPMSHDTHCCMHIDMYSRFDDDCPLPLGLLEDRSHYGSGKLGILKSIAVPLTVTQPSTAKIRGTS